MKVALNFLVFFSLLSLGYGNQNRIGFYSISKYIKAEEEISVLYGSYKEQINTVSIEMLKAINMAVENVKNSGSYFVIFKEYKDFYYVAVLPNISSGKDVFKSTAYIIEKKTYRIKAKRLPVNPP